MAILTDTLPTLDRSVRRKYKKVFARLGDDYVVRTPTWEDSRIADVIIEGPDNTWLLVGNHSANPTVEELKKYVSFALILKQVYKVYINYLAVTEVGDSLFDNHDAKLDTVYSVEAKRFFDDGEVLISERLCSVSKACGDWLKKTVFPEINIRPELTTHKLCESSRNSNRNNTAQLKSYFLDYDQEAAAKLDMIGDTEEKDGDQDPEFSVRLINGVAGSGKTLILVNRARLFCKKYPDQKVLLLIHNKPITHDVEYKFNTYLNGKPKNLAIKTFHSFALAQQKVTRGNVKPLFGDKAIKPHKEKVLGLSNPVRNQLKLSDNQLWSEIEYINDHLIHNIDAYLVVDRQGRGFALQKSQREVVWLLYEQAMALMSHGSGFLPSLYIRKLCLEEGKSNRLEKYDHILLDEAQFFSPSWLQLVVCSLNEGGKLFMCADPNQGFLKSRLSWKSVGLDVRGRTKKLSYSYRTTYEILLAANALLEHLEDDPEDFIRPDLNNMVRGENPKVIYSDTPQDELKRFLSELTQTLEQKNSPLHQIMVLCGESVSPWSLKQRIESAIGENTVTNYNDSNDIRYKLGDRIKLMSMNSCTGMEAGITFVIGVADVLGAFNHLDLGDEEAEVIRREGFRKLYVAMTRAGQKLVLFSTEKLPEYVEKHLDIA